MTIINLHPFGEIDTTELDDRYDSELQCSNKMVRVDLNFEDGSIDDGSIAKVRMIVDRVSDCEQAAFAYLREDFNHGDDSETVKLFVEHHLEELDQDELETLFGTTAIGIDLFMSKLCLTRIGFYPENHDAFVIFDITLQDDVTNYIMAVYFDRDAKITYASMES